MKPSQISSVLPSPMNKPPQTPAAPLRLVPEALSLVLPLASLPGPLPGSEWCSGNKRVMSWSWTACHPPKIGGEEEASLGSLLHSRRHAADTLAPSHTGSSFLLLGLCSSSFLHVMCAAPDGSRMAASCHSDLTSCERPPPPTPRPHHSPCPHLLPFSS